MSTDPDVRYPEKTECRRIRMWDASEKAEHRSDPDVVGCRPDRIPPSGGMSYDSRPGGMSDAPRRKGDVRVSFC